MYLWKQESVNKINNLFSEKKLHFYCSVWLSELPDSVGRILIFFNNNQRSILVIKNIFTETGWGRGEVVFLWRSSCLAVLCVRKMSWKIQSLPAVDTGSADSASTHTGTSLLHQETSPVLSVEKDPEQDLDCRQTVRPALYKVRLKICLLMSSPLKTGQESTSSILLKINAVRHISF